MSTKAKLQETLTDFNIALSQLEGIARDERSRVEGAFHGLLVAVSELPEPVAEDVESAAEPASPVEPDPQAAPEPEPVPEPTTEPQAPVEAAAEPQVAPEPAPAASESVEPSQESALDAPGD